MKSIIFDGIKISPSKIVCIGRNYADHIKELGSEPPSRQVIFIKPNSSISKDIYCSKKDEIHYEGEISFLIVSGKIKGVGFGLDLTKRVLQSELKSKGLPWERAKAFDRSAVFSEFTAYQGDGRDIRLELYINDSLVQAGGYDLMLNKPVEILEEAGSFLSFEDHDLLMTGTPKGVGAIYKGDRFTGRILRNDKLLIEENWIVKQGNEYA